MAPWAGCHMVSDTSRHAHWKGTSCTGGQTDIDRQSGTHLSESSGRAPHPSCCECSVHWLPCAGIWAQPVHQGPVAGEAVPDDLDSAWAVWAPLCPEKSPRLPRTPAAPLQVHRRPRKPLAISLGPRLRWHDARRPHTTNPGTSRTTGV